MYFPNNLICKYKRQGATKEICKLVLLGLTTLFNGLTYAQIESAPTKSITHNHPPTLWFLGIAAHHNSPAFRGDVIALEKSFRQISPKFQSIKLGNGVFEQKNGWLLANPENISHSIQRISAQINANDLLVIAVSTHGAQQELEFSTAFNNQWSINPQTVNSWLAPIANNKIIFMLMACYSGSWIQTLKLPSRIIITSSKSDQTSDGCGPKNKVTDFVQHWQQEFSPDIAIRQIVSRAGAHFPNGKQIPLIDVGELMRPMARNKLKDWPYQLLAPSTSQQ